MASRDEGSRTARHDDEVQGLTTQISFLEEEVAVLRRRLADAPRQSGCSRSGCVRPRPAWVP